MNTVLKVAGMTCTLCSFRIEKGLRGLDGVTKVAVNYASEKVSLEYDPAKIEESVIKKNIEALGFSVLDPNQEVNPETRKLKRLFIWSAILTFPMILMMIEQPQLGMIDSIFKFSEAHGFFLHPLIYNSWILENWIFQLVLATPVQFIIGARFYKNAYLSLKAGSPNMDVLVALGSTVSYFYTIYYIILSYINPTVLGGGC